MWNFTCKSLAIYRTRRDHEKGFIKSPTSQ
jgi:hypothetical protein